ncbi:hypothetical protein FRC00_013048, partial [Tulasnella sp. 408]
AVLPSTKALADSKSTLSHVEVTRFVFNTKGNAVCLKFAAGREVQDPLAREMAFRRNKAKKIAAYDNDTLVRKKWVVALPCDGDVFHGGDQQ